jgi:hypothetical protein
MGRGKSWELERRKGRKLGEKMVEKINVDGRQVEHSNVGRTEER